MTVIVEVFDEKGIYEAIEAVDSKPPRDIDVIDATYWDPPIY